MNKSMAYLIIQTPESKYIVLICPGFRQECQVHIIWRRLCEILLRDTITRNIGTEIGVDEDIGLTNFRSVVYNANPNVTCPVKPSEHEAQRMNVSNCPSYFKHLREIYHWHRPWNGKLGSHDPEFPSRTDLLLVAIDVMYHAPCMV